MAIAEGHHFVAFEVFMPVESEIVAAFLCPCRRPVTVNDAEVKMPFEGQDRHRSRENGIEAPMNFITPKCSIDSGVVNFWLPLFVLFDGQLFPLTTEVQEFQNIVEDRVQRELGLRTPTPPVQMGQDKFLKLFSGQFRGNSLPGLRLSHDYSERLSN